MTVNSYFEPRSLTSVFPSGASRNRSGYRKLGFELASHPWSQLNRELRLLP